MPQSDFMFDGDTIRRLERLEQRLTEIESGRRLEDASIGARGLRVVGGAITIDGGELKLISPGGTVLAYWGDVGFGSGVSRGWVQNFATGDSAFSIGGDPNAQVWALWDRSGNYLITNDASTGVGLARPYLQMWMAPSFDAEQDGTILWPSTAAASATKLMQGVNPIWQPRLTIGVAMAGAGGTGHWRLDINGATVLADETTPGSQTVDIPGWGEDIQPGNAVGIDLYGWVTDGPGRVYLQVDRLHGHQS